MKNIFILEIYPTRKLQPHLNSGQLSKWDLILLWLWHGTLLLGKLGHWFVFPLTICAMRWNLVVSWFFCLLGVWVFVRVLVNDSFCWQPSKKGLKAILKAHQLETATRFAILIYSLAVAITQFGFKSSYLTDFFEMNIIYIKRATGFFNTFRA